MKKILSMVLLMLSAFSCMAVYATSVNEELSGGLLRFHIIANSDSDEDQKIKLSVRDYVSGELADAKIPSNSDQYIKRAETLANKYLTENGVGYTAKAARERIFIPKKSYKNITLPSGEYNAIRLVLGDGAGENWWCVAYPALCFSESFYGELSEDAKAVLKENISEESYKMITGEVEYRLFIVDMIGRIMERL